MANQPANGEPSTEARSGRILIVDDKRDVLTALRLLLKNHVGEVHTARNPGVIPTLLEEHTYDMVLLDMNFTQDASSGREGFVWLSRILTIDPQAVVVMITAYGDVGKAVRAMKEGAADFIVKPWDDADLVASVQAAIKLRHSRAAADRTAAARARNGQQVRTHPQPEAAFDDIIGESPAMQEVFTTIEKVACTDANVLILGENGTGKELVARAVHRTGDELFTCSVLAQDEHVRIRARHLFDGGKHLLHGRALADDVVKRRFRLRMRTHLLPVSGSRGSGAVGRRARVP